MLNEYLKAIETGRPHDPFVHKTAIVDDKAVIGKNVNIGPYSIIGPHVEIADNVWVDSHVSISGKTKIGEHCRIWPFATIGVEPQDLKYRAEGTTLEIGANNAFREYSNISTGTLGGGGRTVIGDSNLFMINSHIGHDSIIGNNCIFANGVSVAGHVIVKDHVLAMGHSAIHQFCIVGHFSLLAGGAMVTKDVVPFLMVHGNRARENGLNLVGLKRAGYSSEEINEIKRMYKAIFRENRSTEEAVSFIADNIPESTEKIKHAKHEVLSFFKQSQRGICR